MARGGARGANPSPPTLSSLLLPSLAKQTWRGKWILAFNHLILPT